MGDLVRTSKRPRFLVRTLLVSLTWIVGAVFSAQVPDDVAQRRAEELAPVVPPTDNPAQQSTPQSSPVHPDSRPSEAPPLIDPPSPTPA